MARAGLGTWNRLMGVRAVATSSPASAPTRRAILSPICCGHWNQPAVFQARISSWPHSWVVTWAMRAGAAWGMAPSELPSR